MKKSLFVFIFLANLAFVFGQKNPIKEYADKEGITTKAIEKNMLAMLPVDFLSGSTDMQAFFDKVSSANVYFTPDKELSDKFLLFTEKLMKGDSYQKMSTTKTTEEEEGGVDASLQSYLKKEGDKATEFIVTLRVGDAMSTVIQMFMKDFTMADVKKIEQQK